MSATLLAPPPARRPLARPEYPAPAAARRPPARPAGRQTRSRGPLRVLGLCLAEARPAVQAIFVLRFLAGAALGAPGALLSHAPRIAAGAAAWFCLTIAIYLFNGACDVPEDRCNGSRRPIASGALPVYLAVRIAALAGALGLALAALVPGALPLAAGLLLLGLAYSTGPAPLKRWPVPCALVVISAGVLSYAAGDLAAGGGLSPRLVVFAAVMSAWMSVGGLAKDLSDVAGDRLAGRRTCPVVLGEGRARVVTSTAALAVAGTFLFAARAFCPLLLTVSVTVLAGAGTLSVIALTSHSRGDRARQRRPYRVFAVTQFVTHLTCLWLAVL